MKDINFDDVELDTIVTTPFSRPLLKGLYTGQTFFEYIASNYDGLWVMTFTVSPFMSRLIMPERILYSIGNAVAEETRCLKGIHTKLYLAKQGEKFCRAFIGSQNFVCPTSENLMVALETKHTNHMVKYFNYFWNQAK